MNRGFDDLLFDAPLSLVRAWLLMAVAALGFSALCAIALVAARAPFIGAWLPHDAFHRALILHVDLATLVWFMSGACALWALRLPLQRQATVWVAWSIAAVGAVALLTAGIAAPGKAVLSNYVPMVDHPAFLAGLIWFALGVVVSAFAGCRRCAAGDVEALEWAKLPLATAVLALVLASLNPSGRTSEAVLEAAVWGAGHLLQFSYVVLMMYGWCVLAGRLGVAENPSVLKRILFILASIPVLAAPLLHWYFRDDAHGLWFAYSQLMRWASWPAATLLGGLLLLRLGCRGRNTPPTTEALALVGSILLFAVGCLAGASIHAETTLVPAHYHGTVGAVTTVLMALTYRMLAVAGARAIEPSRARLQLGLYFLGLLVLILGLAWSGVLGAPRKSPFAAQGASAASMLAASLIGIGGAAAVGAALAFAWMCLASLLRGLHHHGASRIKLDLRLRTIAATASVVAALGATIAWWPQAEVSRARSDVQSTQARVEHAAEMREAEVKARFEQGVLMLHAKQYDHAITAFHRVLELEPQLPEAHVNMGFALIGQQRFEAARDFFDSATELRRDQLNAYYGLAIALNGLDDLPGALAAMRTYLHRAPVSDAFRSKAQAMLAQWEAALATRGRTSPLVLRPPK